MHPHARPVVLSVGSPALTAYSLALTSLNAQSVYQRVQRINHRGKNGVARALISLQQTPLELTRNGRLLAFIWTSDSWRQEIVDRLNRRNAWSVATGSSVAWVVIAFLFTLVDSFVSLNNSNDSGSQGHAVGTLWLWLLCLVAGVLWAPTFTRGELWTATHQVNSGTVKRAAKAARQKAHDVKERITKRIPAQLLVELEEPIADPDPDPDPEFAEEDEKAGDKPIEGGIGLQVPDLTHRNKSTDSSQLHPGSQRGYVYLSVSGNPTTEHSVTSLPRTSAAYSLTQSSIHPDTHQLLIHKDVNSLNREEFRFAATFNYSRVIRYLAFVDDVLGALDRAARKENEVGLQKKRPILEVVSPTLDRSGLPPRLLPNPWGRLCSHRGSSV